MQDLEYRAIKDNIKIKITSYLEIKLIDKIMDKIFILKF